MEKVPEGFIKMGIQLTFFQSSKVVEVFETKILKMLVRDFYIFYSKKVNGDWVELSFYCRPKDEGEISYRMGCYAQTNLDHYTKEQFVNPTHTVAPNFPQSIEIKIN